jgi:hypothetical protein
MSAEHKQQAAAKKLQAAAKNCRRQLKNCRRQLKNCRRQLKNCRQQLQNCRRELTRGAAGRVGVVRHESGVCLRRVHGERLPDSNSAARKSGGRSAAWRGWETAGRCWLSPDTDFRVESFPVLKEIDQCGSVVIGRLRERARGGQRIQVLAVDVQQ